LNRKRLRLASMASMAGLMVILATGCGGTSEQAETPKPETVVVEKTVEVTARPDTTEDTAPPTEATTPTGAETTCEIGKECDLGESSVTVTNAQQTESINTSLGDTFEGNFVIVEFDYTYGGSAPVDLGEPPFRLQDKDGNQYSLDFDATSSYGIDNNRSLIYETVQPGVTSPGAAIFEVSPEANDFTLLVVDLVSPQANETAQIPLTANVPQTIDDPSSAEQQFISEYYAAVGREDWSATYSMLDSASQAQFTEDEWVGKQQAREDASGSPAIESATITESSGEEAGFTATVALTYEGGTTATLPGVEVIFEDGQFKRHLTEGDLAFLENF
jgi:hypothetical protein